jgi:hypothetical protein
MVDTAHPTPNANQDLQDFADALNMEDGQDEVIGTTHYSLLITHYSLLISHLPSPISHLPSPISKNENHSPSNISAPRDYYTFLRYCLMLTPHLPA